MSPSVTSHASNASTALTVPPLFQTPLVEPSVHHKFDFIWSFSFLLFVVGASIAIFVISVRDRPSVLHHHTSSTSTQDNGFTCGCSLPSYLQDPLNPTSGLQNPCSGNATNLKYCYDKSELGNVTLVQFNNVTAVDVHKSRLSTEQFYYASHTSGHQVLQMPKELNLWNGDPTGTLWDICHAIPYTDTIFNFSFNSSLLPMYFDYPQSYMRLVLEYNCSNCGTCSPLQILHDLNNSMSWMEIFDWVECSVYGVQVNKQTFCQKSTNAYHGRCTMYPTFDISMSTRLTTFLKYIQNNVTSLKITTLDESGQPRIEMHANSLYYNQSTVDNDQKVDYAFFEIDDRSSAEWASLVQNYPNLASGNCSVVDQVNRTEICTGTAMCNVFKQMGDNGVSTSSVSCMDFRDNYTGCVQSANTTGNINILEELCGRDPGLAHGNNSSMTCMSVPAHTISYKYSSSVNTSELDYKFFTKYMGEQWNSTYVTGVCANLYENRVRYIHPDSGQLYLLETNCSANDLCHLTGRYNLPNDTSPSGTVTGTGVDLRSCTTPQYTCWKVRPQTWLSWTINLVGVLGGWISTSYAIANIMYGLSFGMYRRCLRRVAAPGPGVVNVEDL